jgi:predicted amidohydrolase
LRLDEFTNQDGYNQLLIVEENGNKVGERENDYHKIWLYQIDSFYVEVFYRKDDNSIWKVGGFDHPVLLNPYLDQVDISQLPI